VQRKKRMSSGKNKTKKPTFAFKEKQK